MCRYSLPLGEVKLFVTAVPTAEGALPLYPLPVTDVVLLLTERASWGCVMLMAPESRQRKENSPWQQWKGWHVAGSLHPGNTETKPSFMPEPLTGAEDDWSSWIRHSERATRVNQWSEEERVELLVLLLKCRKQRVFTYAPQTQMNTKPWTMTRFPALTLNGL